MKELFNNSGKAATAISLAVLLGACSSTPGGSAINTADIEDVDVDCPECNVRLQEIEDRDASRLGEFERREAELARKEQSLQAKESGLASSSSFTGSDDSLLPPRAKPGECYARVLVPAQYKTVTEQVVKKEASKRYEVIPAKYGKTTQRVLVQEASEKSTIVPATYKWVEERILVKPASESTVTIPAVYETVREKVLNKPAHTVWKKGTGPIQRIDESTGEIMCLVDVPASYKTVTRKVLKTPATTKTVTTPAGHKTVKRRVIDRPESTKTVQIPAVYKNISVTELVTPSQTKEFAIPAVYGTVSRTEQTADGYLEWRSILCETNMTRTRISQIQQALKTKGFNPGPIDGIIGSETMSAVNAFQRKNSLSVDKYLNIATVKALGVSPR